VRLAVKVIPSSSRDCIVGWLEDTLKVKVRAPAEKGRANKAVIALLARTLDLPAQHIVIVSGDTSPLKNMEIASLDEAAVLERLPRKSE